MRYAMNHFGNPIEVPLKENNLQGTQQTKLQNDPTITNDRYQAQWKGEGWHVYDSHTNGWGEATFAKAFDAQQAADALNAV